MLSYHRQNVVVQGLRNLLSLNDPPAVVYLVDNSPDDGTAGLIAKEFPSVQIINAGENQGFAAGNNMGMKQALSDGFPYVLLINDDAELLPGSLSLLIESLEKNPAFGAISPIIYYGDHKTVWWAGGEVSLPQGLSKHWTKPRSQIFPYPTGYASGCAVVYRIEALRDVGLFDEQFFMYYEDSDMGRRMNLSGFINVVVPEANALHHVPLDLSRRQQTPHFAYYLERNRILYVRKHDPLRYDSIGMSVRCIGEMLAMLMHRNFKGASRALLGAWHGITGIGGRWQL